MVSELGAQVTRGSGDEDRSGRMGTGHCSLIRFVLRHPRISSRLPSAVCSLRRQRRLILRAGLLHCLAASAQQTRPAEETCSLRLDLIKSEFTQLHDVKERAKFLTNLLLADNGRPRLPRFAGIAGQHQSPGARSGPMTQCLEI